LKTGAVIGAALGFCTRGPGAAGVEVGFRAFSCRPGAACFRAGGLPPLAAHLLGVWIGCFAVGCSVDGQKPLALQKAIDDDEWECPEN